MKTVNKETNYPVKRISAPMAIQVGLSNFPNEHIDKSPNYYKGKLIVRLYTRNFDVTSNPKIYFEYAK